MLNGKASKYIFLKTSGPQQGYILNYSIKSFWHDNMMRRKTIKCYKAYKSRYNFKMYVKHIHDAIIS